MKLRFGYTILGLGLLALIVLTIVRLGLDRQFYELQLRQQATTIDAGLREKWRSHLLAIAKQNRLPKDYILKWDRAGKVLRSPFYPEPGLQLEWAEYRSALKNKDAAAQTIFLKKALSLHRSWDRVLAIGEWQRINENLPTDVALSGYEKTLIDRQSHEAYRLIFSFVEGGHDFTFARTDAEFDQVFFRTTESGEIEAYLPSIDSVKSDILSGFIEKNRLNEVTFGTTVFDIQFPQFQKTAARGLNVTDTFLLISSALLLTAGVLLSASGIREQRNLLLRRVSFLNQVVHELKTPLAGLRLNAQLIKRSGPNEKNLNAIDQSIVRLDRLFDDIVQINRAEKKAEIIDISADDLNQLILSLCEPDLNFKYKLNGRPNATVSTETGRLRVLLRNLFSNGIKYGKSITISFIESADKTEISICDNGPGVSIKDAPKIFDEFYRADSARQTESDGLGLGLSLVKKMATEIQASVRIANPGEPGANFIVTLPRGGKPQNVEQKLTSNHGENT